MNIEDDIVYKLSLTFSHKELAGMYAICNKREQDLIKENAKLKAELKEERETVDFYANKDNWADVDSYEYRGSMINSDDEEATKTMDDSVFVYLKGGKRARETQAKRK